MSITNKYKVNEWYSQSEDFWPMKNPPLNSFFCWVLSFLSLFADSDSLDELSRGYFSASHKLFMRISVIVLEVFFFTFAIITFFNIYYKNLTIGVKNAACTILLITPSLALITHVLFSYDIMCVGLNL